MKRFSHLLQALFLLAASFAVYSFVAAARDGERRRLCGTLCHLKPDYAARNRSAPDFDLPSAAGGRLRLSSYRGKVVVLNFWTKSCRPCLEEMPSLATLASTLPKDGGVAIVTVSTDDDAEDVRATLGSVLGAGAALPTGVDPEASVVKGKYGTHLYPETWIIDPRGVIRARFDGPKDWSSPMMRGFLTQLAEPLTCTAEFENGLPRRGDPESGACSES